MPSPPLSLADSLAKRETLLQGLYEKLAGTVEDHERRRARSLEPSSPLDRLRSMLP